MAKRFRTLRNALTYLQSTTAEGTPVAAPAGSQLKEFQDWYSKQRVITYTRDAASKPGQLDEVAIKPFGVLSTSTTMALVDYSKRAKDGVSTAGVTAALKHAANTTGASKIIGFEPARAVITVVGTGNGTPTDSKITGRKYNKKSNNSYTYPFGQGTAAADASYESRRLDFLTAVANSTKTVSFRPEVFR